MPLMRFDLRNEYGLGSSELYRGAASRKEDPKAVLDGVAAAGLVGVLRQLGDLVQFAADVFQDLHEQVSATSSRGRKMVSRIKRIEERLPSLEATVHGQSNFLHFAYVEGSDWHAEIRLDRSLLRNALPKFMMDSYDECHDPPRLYLLDKFDSSGAGACFKRYSDPSYFKRICGTSESEKSQQGRSKRMYQRNKRVGARLGRGVQFETYISQQNHSGQLASPVSYPRGCSTEITSIRSNSIDFRFGSDSTHESFQNENSFLAPDNVEIDKLTLSKSLEKQGRPRALDSCVEPQCDSPEKLSQHNPEQGESVNRSPAIIWDEKTEIVKPKVPISCDDVIMDFIQGSATLPNNSEFANTEDRNGTNLTGAVVDKSENLFDVEDALEAASVLVGTHFDEVNSETDNYMDALNTMESDVETDSECQTKQKVRSSIIADPLIVSHHLLDKGYGLSSGDDKIVESISTSSDHSDVENLLASEKPVIEENPPKSLNYSEVATAPENLVGDAISQSRTVHGSEKSSDEDDIGNLPPAFKITSSQNISNGQQIPAGSSTNLTQTSTFTTKSNCVDFDSFSEIHAFGSSKTNTLGISGNQSTNLSLPRPEELVSSNDAPIKPPVRIWTNGNLLGLEPSKPPDFGDPCTRNDSQCAEVELDASSVSALQSSNDLHRSTKFFNGKDLHSINISSLVSETKRKWISASSHHFGQSSPPLEHMKIISVLTDSEGSNLKFRFSNRSSCGSNEDLIFPSFQLLPGSAVPSPVGGLESDNESLCRSCPNSSEDVFSPHSDSNSNPWEDEETSMDRVPIYKTEKNEEIDTYGFHSANGNMNHEIGLPFYGSLIMDFPIINSSQAQNDEMKLVDNSMSKTLPGLPHLPQCEPMTGAFYSEAESFSGFTQADHKKNLPEQSISFTQPVFPVPSVSKTKQDHELDEKADFLQQIRDKALNLKRTTALKPNPVRQMHKNLHIAALLEKASAIRQACVGSDDGLKGDDSWSD